MCFIHKDPILYSARRSLQHRLSRALRHRLRKLLPLVFGRDLRARV